MNDEQQQNYSEFDTRLLTFYQFFVLHYVINASVITNYHTHNMFLYTNINMRPTISNAFISFHLIFLIHNIKRKKERKKCLDQELIIFVP